MMVRSASSWQVLLALAAALLVGTSARGQEQHEVKEAQNKRAQRRFEVQQLVQQEDNLLAEIVAREALATKYVQLTDPVEETFGASLQAVNDTMRAQLNIPAGRGLLVATLRPEGPSAEAGLKSNDILLTLADQPLSSAADLSKQLKSAGDKPVQLQILRVGKPMSLHVRPSYRVTLASVEEPKQEYFLGITLEAVDEALRAQLNILRDKGVLITDIVADSPAEKAGVKKHDIVIELAGKTMTSVETLREQIQADKDTPTSMVVVRGGKRVSLPIAGKLRAGQQTEASKVLAFTSYLDGGSVLYRNLARTEANGDTRQLLKRLEQLEKEIRELRESLGEPKKP